MFDKNKEYPLGGSVSFSVAGTGKYPLSKVDLFINDVYAGTASRAPFAFSFTPSSIKNIQKENTLGFVAYDSVMNKNISTVTMKVFGL